MGAAPTTAPPIVQYWNREEVPDPIAELMATFRERNPDQPHLLFNEQSAEEFIAERFGTRQAEAFQACAVPAMQADYFRYCAVHALGGVYADANFVSTLPLRPLLDDEGHLFELPPQGPVLNGLFAFRSPRHPFLALAVEIATLNIENRLCESVALTTGPLIFSGLVRLHRDGSLDAMPQLAGRWKPILDRCWEPLVESFDRAIEIHGPLAEAMEGVRISTRDQMLTWVRKPQLRYKNPERHWGRWEGSIFRPAPNQPSGTLIRNRG